MSELGAGSAALTNGDVLATAATAEDLLASLADDFAARLRRGENPQVEAYVEKYPALAERIRKVTEAVGILEQARTTDHRDAAERPGGWIGRYKLLERIGEGGFGVVFMAEQQQPVRRKVALKVVKPGMDTRQVLARFEAERQALALMEHENIAKVLDAGATESGRPYFVMELVHGVPITDFCDRNQFSPRERLELLLPVCRAIQHAHNKGIIHRDIKPTNVLVTLQEGVPVPKVIDFGVAKATGQQLTEKTLFTHFAQMVGTPLYMSPEQAEMSSLDVDTRSDVYSLGVLLYELLTGATPVDKDRFQKAAFDEVRRIIREEEPPPPSTRLSTMAEQARSILAAKRKSDPAQLGKLMRGELDWIVMKALEKERARRYETPISLARDIERYLRDEPVEACPASNWYRLRKFARRRRGLFAAIGATVLFALAGAGMLAVSTLRVSGALRKETEANAKLATALERERTSLDRERWNSYLQRIALANREWSANNLSRMETLLDECPTDLRGWEWHYLNRLRSSAPRALLHDSPVLCVTFSPDAKYVATGTQAGVVHLWRTKSGRLIRKWPAHALSTPGIAFSPDGRRLATGSSDGKVKIWALENVLKGDVRQPLAQLNHESYIRHLAFSPNGRRLAVAAGRAAKEFGEIKIWDLESLRAERTLEFTTQVNCVQFSSDGQRLAAVDVYSLTLWDVNTGRQVFLRRDVDGLLEGVAFSPDDGRLATVGGLIAVSANRAVKLWDAQDGREITSFPGHVGGLRSVAFSRPDGRRLASAGLDQTVKLWDTRTGDEVLTLRGHLDNVFCITFSADGRLMASASVDRTVRLWDATPVSHERTPESLTLPVPAGAVTDVAFHPTEGRRLVSATTDGAVHTWNARDGKLLDTLQVAPSDWGARVDYSPDGRRLAVVSGMSSQVALAIYASSTTELGLLEEFQDQNGADLCVAFAPDGRHVASGGMDWVVRVRDADTGAQRALLEGHTWPVLDLAFSPNGRHLASASSDDTVRVWDWAEGKLIKILEPAHLGRVTSVAFSRDGTMLASASWDQTLKTWNTANWEMLDELPDPTGGILCVAFGPGRRLAWGSTDSTVKVWDGPGTDVHVLRGHTSWVQAVAFSPDGKSIAAAGLDKTVRVWPAPRTPTTDDGESEE
jgi:WD40 repeat protein/serine/threonine protein kinase